MNSNRKFKGLVSLLLVLALSSVAYIRLFTIQNEGFPKQIASTLYLCSETPAPALTEKLNRPERISDLKEANSIAGYIVSRIPKGKKLPGISVLSIRDKKRDFSIALDSVGRAFIKGNPYLEARLQAYDQSHGVLDLNSAVFTTADALIGMGDGKRRDFTISIQEKGKIPFLKRAVRDTIALRISHHWREYGETNENGQRDCIARDSIYCYILVSGGNVKVSLPIKSSNGDDLYYSILPIQEGYSFGAEQGTFKNILGRMTFIRTRAYLMPLGKDIIRDIKEQGDIIVRTPEQYKMTFFGILFLLIIAWIAVFLVVLLRDARLGITGNYGLIVATAGIIMLGVLTLLSIPAHPLQDNIRATSQLIKGVIPGIVALLLSSRVNWRRLFEQDRKAYRNDENQGAVLASIAILTAVSLFLFGSGPGGAKVNIAFFQGQPIIRYAVVAFGAIYLSNRHNLIPSFASRYNKYDRERHIKLVIKMVSLLIMLLVFQIAFLGDMGPGIVLALTVVCMYSTCRKDSVPMLVGVASFLVLAFFWRIFWGSDWTITIPILWTIAWVLTCRLTKGQIYESAILIVIIISALLYGGQWLDAIGLHHMGERLADRIEIWRSPFNNRTTSDQLALAIYEYAEGGLFGRTGTSMAFLVPAAHTDFIWASYVSHWGLLGGALLLALLAILFRSGLNTAARSTCPFSYYFSFGIMSSIAIQSIFILGSTTCLWPLSGVPLFGMSYGSTSLVLDLAAIGVLISLSREKETANDTWSGKGYAVKMNAILYLVSVLLLCLIAVKTAEFSCFRRDENLTKATIVQSLEGDRVLEYAQTVERFVKTGIKAGETFDRKGVVLAKNGPDGKRIYPAKDHTFFLTGDLNTMTLASRTDRYVAGVLSDYRWDKQIRGFDIHPKREFYISDKLQSPYFPDTDIYRVDTLVTYNYSEVLPLWKSPKDTERWNADVESRSITLTMDSHLQDAIIEKVEEFWSENTSITSRTRLSLVIIDAETGDVLASVCFPTVDENRIRAMAEAHINVYRDDCSPDFQAFPDMDLACCYATNPGSIIKLVTAAAGFRKIGSAMADHREYVRSDETIYSHDPTGLVTLPIALGISSNNYFIRSLNNLNLYDELGDIYWTCGIRFNNRLPYCLYPSDSHTDYDAFKADIRRAGIDGRKLYADYCESGKHYKMNSQAWAMAWGQGPVAASPLAIARILGGISTGFVMNSRFKTDDPVLIRDTLLSAGNAQLLRDSMKPLYGADKDIKGKTGTPERQDRLSPTNKSNDAWYGCYINGELNPASGHNLALCVRFERTGQATSKLAVKFVKEKLMPVLENEGYLSRL